MGLANEAWGNGRSLSPPLHSLHSLHIFFFSPLPNERDLPVFDDQFLSNERRLGSKVRNTYDIDVAN